MAIGSLISGGVGLVNGFFQRKAADKAAKQQAEAAAAAKADLKASADRGAGDVTAAGTGAAAGVRTSGTAGHDAIIKSLGYLDPYSTAGAGAVQQASDLTSAPVNKFGFDSSTVGMDPGYLLRQKEANKTMLQNGAAFGNLQSGGFAKAFQDRNQQAASDETQAVFNRQKSTFDTNQNADQSRVQNLLSIMGFGERANSERTAGTGDASRLDFQGQQSGGQFETGAADEAARLRQEAAMKGADLTTGAGTAQAVGTINKSNAITGALNNIDWGSIFKPRKAVTP